MTCLYSAASILLRSASAGLSSVGEISNALSPLLGENVGRLVFSAGVLGASLASLIHDGVVIARAFGFVDFGRTPSFGFFTA